MKGATVAARGMRRALVGLLAGFTALSAIRSTITVVAEFEESLALVGAVAQASALELEALEATARQTGATTRFSASEAADGLLFLSRAGFEVSESIAALPSTLHLAQVGMIDLGRAADFASNIVAQFGLSAEETVRVVDALVIASNRSNTSVSQAAEAMKFAGTVLGQLGVQVEETANLIGVLGDRGIQASQAGTNLRAVFLKLQAPTEAGAAALKRFSLSAQDVDVRSNDVSEVFDRLIPLLKDTSAAVDIFGIRNVAAAQTIALSTDRLRELNDAQIEFVGEAERVAAAIDDTLIGAFKGLSSAIQETILQVGESGILNALRKMVDTLSGAIRVLNDTTSAEQQASFASSALAASLSSLSFAISGVSAALLGLKLGGVISGFGTALGRAAFGTTALGKALFKLGSPLGLAAVAVTGALITVDLYTSRLIEASNETRRLADETFAAQNRIVSDVKGIERAAFDLERALEFDDAVGEMAALNTQARILENQLFKLEKEAAKAKEELKTLSDVNPDGIFAEGFDANFQPRFEFREVARILPEADARALAERLGLEFEQAIKQGGGNVTRAAYIEAIDAAAAGLRAAAKEKAATRVELKVELVLTADEQAAEDAFDQLLEIGNALQFEKDTASLTSEEVASLRFEHELLALATAANLPNAEALTEAWVKANEANVEAHALAEQARRDSAQRQADDERELATQERMQERAKQAIEDLKFETTLVGLSNVEREKAIFLRQLEAEAMGLTAEEIAALNEEYGTTLDRLTQMEDDATRSFNIQRQLAGDVGDTLRGGFEDAILGLDKLEDVGKRVFEELRQAAVRAAIAAAFGPSGTPFSFFGGGSAPDEALGGAYVPGGGRLAGLERGGIVSNPSLISSAQGIREIAENEPEAVMPLRRTSGGRLGIEVANPDAGGSTKAPVNFTMHINGVSDFDSFKKNERQIAQGAQRMLNRTGA